LHRCRLVYMTCNCYNDATMDKGKRISISGKLVNWFTMKNTRHNRALRDTLDLVKNIEGFCEKYRLQDELSDFQTVFATIGEARIDATEVTYRIMRTLRIVRLIDSKRLPALLLEVYNDFEELKRSLYTRTLGSKVLQERVLKLNTSFENMLAEISKIEYK